MEPKEHIPPTSAQRFLQWFLREELAEEVLGDLEEQFFAQLDQGSPFQARLNYWYQVLNYLRPFAIRLSLPFFQNNYAMFKNYYTIAWRNLFKYKMYSIIKIGGFAIGVAACFLIALYMRDELSYDKHYEDGEQIFRLINTDTRQGKCTEMARFSGPHCRSDAQ